MSSATATTDAGTLATTFPVGGGSSPFSGVVRCYYRHTIADPDVWGVLTDGAVWLDDIDLGSPSGPTLPGCTFTITADYAEYEFDVDTAVVADGDHTLTLIVRQLDGAQVELFRHRITFTSSNGNTRRGAIAADLFLEPGEAGDFSAVAVQCDGDPSAVPAPTGLPDLTDTYYSAQPGTLDPGPTPSYGAGVLTYTAGTGDKSSDVTQYDVTTDAGDVLTHLVYTRVKTGLDCRPHFGRSGTVRTTYDAADSYFPLGLFQFNAGDPSGYGAAAKAEMAAAGFLPTLGFLPPIPPNCASQAEWEESAVAWWDAAHSLATAWGGPVYCIDDDTFSGSDLDERLGWAAHQSWFNDAVAAIVAKWRTLPCGLPAFVVAKDEVELAFGRDPEDTGNANVALLGAGTAALYTAAIRAANGPPVGFLSYGLSTLSNPRGTSLWQEPTYSDFTHFSGDTSDALQGGRIRLPRADRSTASCVRCYQTDRPNISLFPVLQWTDAVWVRDGTREVWQRVAVTPAQVPAFAMLPIIRGSVAMRAYQCEPDYYRRAVIEPGLASSPNYPVASSQVQYGARFDRSGEYWPEANASGDALLIVANVIQDYTPLLLGIQVTCPPWGPGWRVGRWESSRGTLLLAVNVSGLTESVPATLDVSGFTTAEWVDGDLRTSLAVGDVPGLSVPADRVVVLTA